MDSKKITSAKTVKAESFIKKEPKRISKEQYNKEINEAVMRIEKGEFVTHKNALKELMK